MKIKTLITLVFAGVLAMACKKNEPVTQPEAERLPIKLSASLYQFTKATDTSFENGDEIAVNIFNPDCYLYKAKYTYNNGSLTSETVHQWYEDTEVEATITAFYPCTETMEGYTENQSFMIESDQSTKTGYCMSDLMLATAKSKPTKEAVKLPFRHALSKIVVTIDNQLNEAIENVWFTDVLGNVSYKTSDPLATLQATGSTGTVKAYKNGEDTWQLIVAPQTASPKLALTTASGKQYTFVLSEEVTLSSGKVSTATVTVSAETIYTSFTPEISDWVADNELNFSQEETENPETTGTIIYLETNPNGNWAQSNPRFAVYSWNESGAFAWTDMHDLNGDLIYKAVLPEGHTNLIFCRMNPATNENRWNNWDGENKDTDATKPIWNQSDDLTLPTDGTNCYVVADDAWDKGTGIWKTIEAFD